MPVILDTDIGTDIDDTWALAFMLRCPELDVKLVVSDTGNTEYRAALVARLLEAAGRTDIPVGVGIKQSDERGGQAPWVEKYSLDSYPGRLCRDGVDAIITPLDTCGQIRLRGEKYAAVARSQDPLARAVIENYRTWRGGKPDTESSILFDTVAVHLGYSTRFLHMERMHLRVTDDGFTVPDGKGSPVNVAIRWTDLAGFEDALVSRLAGSSFPERA